jgi:hypothetical protein
MSERGVQLLETANEQLSELSALLSTMGEGALSVRCAGREKLGDGSVAACASHTADSYERIAGFVEGRTAGTHVGDYGAENVDREDLLKQLSGARHALSTLGDLTDEELDLVPRAGDMKFCDGKRTLEQVLRGLLNHQSHNVDVLRAAVSFD